MKTKTLICLAIIFFFLVQPAWAGDFILEYVAENYKETRASHSYDPVIYHAIQVNTAAGPKMLVLKGEDYHYRSWLRQYIARGKQFIAQIPDEQDHLFVSSKVFDVNVTDIHPVNLSLFHSGAAPDPAPVKKIQTDAVPPARLPHKKPMDLKKKDWKIQKPSV